MGDLLDRYEGGFLGKNESPRQQWRGLLALPTEVASYVNYHYTYSAYGSAQSVGGAA